MEVESNYSLSHLLLQRLCKTETRNFVFSPLSLGTCFAMTAFGLRGEAKTELLDFLRVSDEESLHSAFEELLADEESPFKIVNKFLVSDRCELDEQAQAFLEVSRISIFYSFLL